MADPTLRCSVQYRAADPIGTAGDYDTYLLVEAPLPWGKDIESHPVVRDVLAGLSVDRRIRVLGMVPHQPDRAGAVRVVAYRRAGAAFSGYIRSERDAASADEVVATCNELLSGPATPSDGPAVTDLLVCTHGTRDRCCGSFGTQLHTSIGDRYAGEGVRTWRVSHTGGHRFAPTAIVLPEGTMWAWLDTALVHGILHRSIEPARLAGHYRGSSGIGSPVAQVAEREAFIREGWSWLDSARSATVERNGDRHVVQLRAAWPDGRVATYEAVVEQRGIAPQPVCGEPIDHAKKADPVWSLTDFAGDLSPAEPAVS